MQPSQGYFLKTMDIDAVYGAIVRTFPPMRQVVVGAAGGWVAVYPDTVEPRWQQTAAQLAAASSAWTIAVHVATDQRIELALVDERGEASGALQWQEESEAVELESLHVELRGWHALLVPSAPPAATAALDVSWSTGVDCLLAIGDVLEVPNLVWAFERLIAHGSEDTVEGWRTFRARIDGIWMQLAARRWLDPLHDETAPEVLRTEDFSETGDFNVDDLSGPLAWLDISQRALAPGQTAQATVHIVTGDDPIGVVDVVVRISGLVVESGEPRQYESSMEIARSERVEADAALVLPVMIEVPRNALAGGGWRIQASAVLVSGDYVTATETLEVVESAPRPAPPRLERAQEPGERVGGLGQLEALPALVFADGQVVYARGRYHVTMGEATCMERGRLLAEQRSDDGGLYARLWRADDDAYVTFAVRPSGNVDLSLFENLLAGVPARDFILDAADPELGVSGLVRWDQLQRRALVAFGRALQAECVGGEGVLAGALAARVQGSASAPPADDTPESTLGVAALFLAVCADPSADEPEDLTLYGWDRQGESAPLVTGRSLHPVDVDDAFYGQLAEKLEAGQAEAVVAQVDAAIATGLVDARLYTSRARALEQLAAEMRRYGTRIGFDEWAFEEPYRARAAALEERLQRSLRAALWIGPTAEAAARLAMHVRHPLEQLQAWERALMLEPERLDFRYARLTAAMHCEGRSALEAARRLDALEVPPEREGEGVRKAWVRSIHQAACVHLSAALHGGEPSFLHHGLAGDPTPVVATGDAIEHLRQARAALGRLDESWPHAERTASMKVHVDALHGWAEQAGEGGTLDLTSASRLAKLARSHRNEQLGRFARAVALTGYARERDPARLITRAKVCQAVFAHEASRLLLQRARILASHSLLPVLDAEASLLRAQGKAMRAMTLEDEAARIAPEQIERANRVFDAWTQQGLLHRAEDLFRYFLTEVSGSTVVRTMLARWALQIAEVYEALQDSVRALRPIEWLLFVEHEIDAETLKALRERREHLVTTLPHRGWYEPVPDDEPVS